PAVAARVPAPPPPPVASPVAQAAQADDGPPPDDAPWPEPDDDLPPWESLPPAPAPAAVAAAAAAPEPAAPVLRIPVRDPGSPGRLDQPRPAATPLQPTPEGDFWNRVVQQLIESGAVNALVR